ncbi:MAG: hypothetical protein Kow00103_02230 [Candidatus Caldatribacteriota bacterium]
MKSKIFLLFLIVLALILINLVGCAPTTFLPDLVPANPPGMAGYCNVDDASNLIVYIKNQGEADAPACQVKVQFYLTSGVQEFSTSIGPIPMGNTQLVSFAIPMGCYNPDCDFVITVDSGDEVIESDETNNTTNGTCIG